MLLGASEEKTSKARTAFPALPCRTRMRRKAVGSRSLQVTEVPIFSLPKSVSWRRTSPQSP